MEGRPRAAADHWQAARGAYEGSAGLARPDGPVPLPSADQANHLRRGERRVPYARRLRHRRRAAGGLRWSPSARRITASSSSSLLSPPACRVTTGKLLRACRRCLFQQPTALPTLFPALKSGNALGSPGDGQPPPPEAPRLQTPCWECSVRCVCVCVCVDDGGGGDGALDGARREREGAESLRESHNFMISRVQAHG